MKIEPDFFEFVENYRFLEQFLQRSCTPNKLIFKTIGELDITYKDCQQYWFNINGMIGNLGVTRNDTILLNAAISRIKKLPDEIKNIEKSKIEYDLGLLQNSLADIKYPHHNQNITDKLEATEFEKARAQYDKVKNDSSQYTLAQTNEANILDSYGRNYEAILHYDKVLTVNPSFGMALGNKAASLIYYYQLSKYNPIELLWQAKENFTQALKCDQIQEIGGYATIEHFKSELSRVTKNLEQLNYTSSVRQNIPTLELSHFQKFIVENNLYLNDYFGFLYHPKCLQDDLLPSFVHISSPKTEKERLEYNGYTKNIFYCIKYYNQILEDFATCRLLYFESISSNAHSEDNNTNYIDLGDSSMNSINFGKIKIALARLFSMLDKIAQLTFRYFELELKEEVYFSHLRNEQFRTLIQVRENYQLLALYSLSRDFETGNVYHEFRELRNLIVHEFVDVCSREGSINDEKYSRHHLTIPQIQEKTLELFKIVKAAFLYMTISIEKQGDLIESAFGPSSSIPSNFQ